MLDNLRLEHNRLSGPLPTQLSNLSELSRIYVKGNSGITGCVPAALRNVRTNDLANLSLPTCAADAPDTPETPLPAYTLTVTAGDGGAVDPPGASTHTEGVPVVVTASWNDATHSFAGWSGPAPAPTPPAPSSSTLPPASLPPSPRSPPTAALPRPTPTASVPSTRAARRLRPGPGHPGRAAALARRRRPLPGQTRPPNHRSHRRPTADRLVPLLP